MFPRFKGPSGVLVCEEVPGVVYVFQWVPGVLGGFLKALQEFLTGFLDNMCFLRRWELKGFVEILQRVLRKLQLFFPGVFEGGYTTQTLTSFCFRNIWNH